MAGPLLADAAQWLAGCTAFHLAASLALPASRRFSALDERRASELENLATASLHAALCFVGSASAIAPLLDLGHANLFRLDHVTPNSDVARLWMARMCGYLCVLHSPPAE